MYNASKYIEDCLISILNQHIPSNLYEIIIVNDCSTDDSVQIIENFKKENTEINLRIINHEINLGVATSRNSGIKSARGEYLCFIDADDFFLPNSLLRVFDVAKNSQNFDIITYGIQNGDPQKLNLAELELGDGSVIEIKSGKQYINRYNYRNETWWYFVRRDYLTRCGLRFADGKLLEDGVFTVQMFFYANKIAKVNQKAYFYATRPNSIMTTIDPKRLHSLIGGFKFAISFFSSFIDEHQAEMPIDCYNRLIERQQSYTFFLIIRLLKWGTVKDIKETLNWLSGIGQYPIHHLIGKDYHGKRIKRLLKLINKRWVCLSLARIQPIIRKIKK